MSIVLEFNNDYESVPGTLGIIKQHKHGTTETYHCREDFHHDYFHDEKMFAFLGSLSKAKKLLTAVEKKLKIPLTKRAKLQTSTSQDWFCVTPRWWNENVARIQFLTILLRASLKYTTIEGMKQHQYFQSTPSAVDRFLNGYTCLADDIEDFGWVNHFEYDYAENAASQLISERSLKKFQALHNKDREALVNILEAYVGDNPNLFITRIMEILSK